jgi:hypothetical protein
MFNPQPLVSDLYSKHYENYVRTLNNGRKLTAYFNLTAQDVQALTISDKTGTIVKDFRSLFYVRIGSSVMPFRLESVNDFVAGKNQSTKVVMITDVDNISQQVAPFINSMQFVNDTSAIGTAYANCSVSRFGSIWSEVRSSGTGSVVTQGTVYGAGGTKGSTYRIERMFLFFDTSNLPEGATITEAYIDLYKVAGDYSQEVALFAGYQSGIVTLDDYDAYGTTLFGQSVAGTLGVRRIILNAAGKSHLNKTGWTKFCVREYNYDGLNNIPALNYTTFKTYQYGSPSQYRNKLTVKYTL